jgi:outer membrane protein assembly factor BamB
MQSGWSRRAMLRGVMGAVGAAGMGSARELFAQDGAAPPAEEDTRNWLEPNGLVGEPIKLPTWAYGKNSSAPDAMLMFRGNASHTFYGTGSPSEKMKVVWKQPMAKFHTKLRGKPITWTGSGWTGQAAYYAGHVFAGSVGGYVYAYDATTGDIKWRFQGRRMFKGSMCIYENRCYMGNTDDMLRCLDASTGKLIWELNSGTDLDSSPQVYDGKLYIAGESGFVRRIDPGDGKIEWKTFVGGTGKGTLPGSNGSETSPAIADGELYTGTYDGFLYCLDIQTGKIKWKTSTGDDTDVSPVIHEGLVFTAAEDRSPKLFCFDREKQGKEVWSFDNGRGWWSTPALADGAVYVGGQDGKMYCFEATSGKKRWEFDVGAAIWSSPAVVDGKVIFGAYDAHMHMLDAKTGKRIWKMNMGGRVIATPIIIDGAVWVGTATGMFYCLK